MHDPMALPQSSGNALAMEAALAPEERSEFPLVWRGDWFEYSTVYMDEVARRFMGGRRR